MHARVGETYVYHESTRGRWTLSTVLTRGPQKTTWKSQCDVLSKRNRGLSRGQEVTANVGRPSEAGHLQGGVSLGYESGGKSTNVSSYSFRLTFDEE